MVTAAPDDEYVPPARTAVVTLAAERLGITNDLLLRCPQLHSVGDLSLLELPRVARSRKRCPQAIRVERLARQLSLPPEAPELHRSLQRRHEIQAEDSLGRSSTARGHLGGCSALCSQERRDIFEVMAIDWTSEQRTHVARVLERYPLASGRCESAAWGIFPVGQQRDPWALVWQLIPDEGLYVVPKLEQELFWFHHFTAEVEAHCVTR